MMPSFTSENEKIVPLRAIAMSAAAASPHAPAIAARLSQPADLARETLLRSYRAGEWNDWFRHAGMECPALRGTVFDSSLTLAEAAAQGLGVALLPMRLFSRDVQAGRLIAPFPQTLDTGSYWLTRLQSRAETSAMAAFKSWLLQTAQQNG